jgi:hypothetical protein
MFVEGISRNYRLARYRAVRPWRTRKWSCSSARRRRWICPVRSNSPSQPNREKEHKNRSVNKHRRHAVLLLVLLTGMGDLICQAAYAQPAHPAPQIRFDWIDPLNKFIGVESGKQDIEKAVARQISRNAEKIHNSPGTTTGISCSQAVAEWLVQIEVEPRVLTYSGIPETWWRVTLNICWNDGDKSWLITKADNRILYDFDDFPPFDDTTNLLSDLSTRVGEQLRQFSQAGNEASSADSELYSTEVIRQIRKRVEADELPAVEAIQETHERKFDASEPDALSDSQLLSFLEYHKMLGGLYTHLSVWGGSSEASKATVHLEQAQQASYLLEDRLGGSTLILEMPDVYRLNREISTMLDLNKLPLPLSPKTEDYIGDDVRIAVGYDSETHLTGEFFWNVFEQADSAFSFEGWKGTDSAGGLKLNFHWLGGDRQSDKDIDGKMIYSDGRVRKLFLAPDWNIHGDGKLTFGGGGERRDHFWSAYASKSITGERLLGSDVSSFDTVSSGITIDLHRWTQTDTLTMTTEHVAHPYNWGVGFRFGRFIDSSLLRFRGGLDYEFGDYNSSQLTASANLEKRFLGSNQGLSLRVEVLRKQGDFETDQSDVRFSVLWSWDFGTIFRRMGTVPAGTVPADCPIEIYDKVEAAWIRRALRNPVGHKRTVDYYRYDRVSELLETTHELFNEGPHAVDDTYTVGRDSSRNILTPEVLENDSDSENDNLHIVSFTQPHNGTVELEGNSLLYTPNTGFTGEDTFTYTIEDLYTTTPHAPGPKSTATVTIIVENKPPVAVDDNYEVMKNSQENSFVVMENDYDPDGDPISIIMDSVTSPTERGGAAVVTGTTVSYSPAAGYCGVDRFTYAVEDDKGAPSNMATVTVTVTNKPPVAVNDSATTNRNRPIVIPVLANDYDPDGDSIEITDISPAERRGTVIDNGNGTVTYTPYRGWWGVDSFQYTIIDDCGDTATATVTVDISPDIPPVVSPQPGT